MGLTDGIINQIAELSKARIEQGDYTKDGLLYCGKCETPKQCRISFDGTERIVGCMCKCAGERYERAEREEKENQKRIRIKNLRVNGIQDNSLRDCRFENQEMTPLLMSCKKYVDRWDEVLKRNHGLIFWGDVGSGKTIATACIANALIDRGVPVLMTSFHRILSIDYKNRSEQVEQISNFPLLVIDDLGVERSTEYSLEMMYYVLDERYKSKKPLIVTTNITKKEIENPNNIEYKRIFSRITEMCQPVRVSGVNFREKKTIEKRDDFIELFRSEK